MIKTKLKGPVLSNAEGITLIEILVALSIFSLVILIIGMVYVRNLFIFKRESTYHNLQTSGKVALDKILYDIRSASEAVTTVTEGSKTYNSSSSEIILKVPALNSAKEIRYDSGTILYYDYIIYTFDVEGGKIIKNTIINSNSYRSDEDGKVVVQDVVDSGLSYFSYQPENPPSDFSQVKAVSLAFRLSKIVKEETLKVDFQSEAKLRNK